MGPQGAFDLRHNHRVDGARPLPSGFGGRGGRALCGLQRREGREKEGNGWVCGEDGCREERGGRRREGVGMVAEPVEPSRQRIRGIDGPNLDAERDMADLHLEPNVSFKDKLMKSTRRLNSVAVSDFDFDLDLVDGDVSFSHEAEAKMSIKRRYAAY
ncbi:hypothetical protein ACFX1W_029704 [Malus domestica]